MKLKINTIDGNTIHVEYEDHVKIDKVKRDIYEVRKSKWVTMGNFEIQVSNIASIEIINIKE